MAGEFLGRGWSFPVSTDDAGSVDETAGVADIEAAVRIVLGTAKGERVMRPEFGCGIHDYAFATVDASTLTLIETEVEDALVRWEPRIEVRSVDIETTDLGRGRLDVHVDYRVRDTNNEHNLVYPFYLEEGSGRA